MLQVTVKWKDLLLSSESPSDGLAMDITGWLFRATLDAIGEGESTSLMRRMFVKLNFGLAAFDYKVGALDDKETDLARGYNNLM